MTVDYTNAAKAVAAMGCITVLEMYALSQGINGQVLSLVVGLLAGLGGYALSKITGNSK